MSEIDLTRAPQEEVRIPRLERQTFEIRALKSGFLTGLTWAAAGLAAIPLFSVIYLLLV